MWTEEPDAERADSKKPIAVRLIVYGHVQGVGFRAWTASRAHQLAIKGWVRNNRDSSVEIFAEGLPDNIDAFMQTLKTGHPWARVDRIERTSATIQNLPTFSIVG